MDDLLYVVNHVFMPLNVPQKNDRTPRNEQALAEAVATSTIAYRDRLLSEHGGMLPSPLLPSVVDLLTGLADLYNSEDDYSAEAVKGRLAGMDTGDISAFLIREQNAGVIFRVRSEDVICESFEVSATNAAVMACENRLIRTFPGPCLSIPRNVFENPYFRGQLSIFVSHMNRELLEGSAVHARKAKTTTVEVRDTAHPRYITNLLMTILLTTGGKSNTFILPSRTIQKRVADDVLWHNAYTPWRRSQLWLVIRVALQTTLPEVEYKTLLLYLMIGIARRVIDAPAAFDNSIIDCMRKKIGRRAAKLHVIDPDSLPFVLQEAQQVCEDITAELSRRWKIALDEDKPRYNWHWKPEMIDVERDTYLRLPSSASTIQALSHTDSGSCQSTSFVPPFLARINWHSFDAVIRKRLLRELTIGRSDRDLWHGLFDFEAMVHGKLASWISFQISFQEPEDLRDLVSTMQEYYTITNRLYSGNPEAQSIMILTILELWMAIDKIATHSIPLLLSYPPEIPATLLEPLLLHSRAELERARALTVYLNDRARAATRPSIFSFPSQSSFAVQYFGTSHSLQQQKADIEQRAQAKQAEKEAELRMLNERIEAWEQAPHDLTCIPTRKGALSKCNKCSIKKNIRRKISINEWPLPTDQFQAKYTVFEMYAPPVFIQWREATYSLLSDMFAPVDSSRRSSESVHEKLGPYMNIFMFGASTKNTNRITLGSTTKSWKQTHYKSKTLPAASDEVCVPSALQWRLYDTKSQRLIPPRLPTPATESRCTLRLSADPAYEGMQWALDSVHHQENMVVARQAEHPRDLSPHEFVAFGCLRAGAHVQWMNVARAIAARTLSFRSPSVHALISQTIQQVGPFVVADHPFWHEDLASESFCVAILSSAQGLLNSCSKNWQEIATIQTIVAISTRVLADTRITETVATLATNILHQCREVTCIWVADLVADLPGLSEEHVSARKETIRQVAATCCLTMDTDGLSVVAADWSKMISCLIILHDNRLTENDDSLNCSSRVILDRVRRFAHQRHQQLCDAVSANPNILDQPISRFWSAYRPMVGWSTMPGHLHWLHAKASARNGTGEQDVYFNTLNGAFLVDGKSIGNLPVEITGHSVYRRLFNQTVLCAVPAGIPDFEYKTTTLVSGNEVFFMLQDGDLLIQSFNPETGKTFRYIPNDTFTGDLPTPLVRDFAHWLDLTTFKIDFRSISNPWISTPHSWQLDFISRCAERVDKDGHRYMLLSTETKIFAMVRERLKVMDDPSYLVMTIRNNIIDIYMQRLQLAFQIDLDAEFSLLESKTYPGFAVDEDQGLGTLVGLRSKLILRDASSHQIALPRRVLIPYGRVSYIQSRGRTSVQITTDADQSSVLHTQLIVDQDLGVLVGDGTLQCHFFRILLHALTSQPLSDPLTGRTGTTQALDELASAFSMSFQQLGPQELALLEQIRALTPRRIFYPDHLRTMQTIQWSKHLPSFAQRVGYEVLVCEILDYDTTLHHIFYDDGFGEVGKSQYDACLLARAVSRESAFPLADLIGAFGPAPRDTIYTSRHLEQVQDCFHYSAGLMISSLNPGITQPTQHLYGVFEGIQAESLSIPIFDHSIVRAPTSMSAHFLSSWSDDDIAEFWFGMYKWCYHVQPPPEARYLLLFSLCSEAFATEDVSLRIHLLPYLIGIFKHASELSPLPRWTSYTLSNGHLPSTQTVTQIIARAVLPRDRTPLATVEMPEDTRSKYSARDALCNTRYQTSIREGSFLLLQIVMAQWESSHCETTNVAIMVDRALHPYFDLGAITTEVTHLFVSCRRNSNLHVFLDGLKSVLRSSSNRLKAGVSGPKVLMAPLTSKPRRSHITSSLNLLLETNIGSCPASYIPLLRLSPTSGGSVSRDEMIQLRGILETLATSSAHLRRVYATKIAHSVMSLQSKVEHSPPDAPSIARLLKHCSDCSDACDALVSHIRNLLRPTSPGQIALAMSGLWPIIDSRSLILQLRKGNWANVPSGWKNTIMEFAAVYMYTQQSKRMVHYSLSGQMTELSRELQNYDLLDRERSKRHPDWYLIQIANNFRARSLQLDVAEQMFSPPRSENITLQLNMGEGKTAIIVPMVASSLADGNRLVRVIVLKPLAPQMFQLLRERVSMFCDRHIFYLPFSRQLKLNAYRLSKLHDLHEMCRRTGGILVTQPEHALSIRLLAVEKMITQDHTNNTERIHAVRLHQLLAKNARDILDESDELLHTRYQLIYTMGAQQDLQCSPNRWLVMQDVLLLAGKHVETLLKGYGVGSGIEVQRPNVWAFPLVKLPESFGDELIGKVVVDVMEGQRVRGLNMLFIPSEHAHIIRDFITHRIPRDSILSAVQQLFEPDPMFYNVLLLLRGLFVEGLLVHVLCQPRWRVDYGLVEETRSLLAVPYRAKDVPSPRSEFGHPDIAILLTCLAYYYKGLDEEQLKACLNRLLLDSNPVMLYESWIVDIPLDILPISLRHVSGINLNDTAQFAFLYDIFRYCRAVIDFYLARAVFPRAMKEFPDKLSSSGWDLAERRVHPTTGFSGTNDNQLLLPTSITQVDPVDQSSTNALVLTYLLRPENAEYTCTRDATSGRTMSGQQLVSLLAVRQEVRAFLDVGAQMLDLSNHNVATQWLAEREDIDAVQAAIYFNDKDELMVVRRNGDLELLQSSVYRDRLWSCLVYLDDAHTRGTDLKMPREWRAAVTIGKKVTKDRLVQGCMRMRQLGKGQSLSFLAPPDVDTLIRNSRPSPSDSAISVADIVHWTMLSTCIDITHHAPQWAQQGTDFLARSSSLQSMSTHLTSMQQQNLRSMWLQRESRTLTELYGVKASTIPVDTHPKLVERLRELGLQAVYSRNVDEEQEREISLEVEAEQQREHPGAPQVAKHRFDPKLRAFAMRGLSADLDSLAISPLVVVKPILDRHLPRKDPFSKKFRVTRDFAVTVQGADNGTNFLKDVQWVLRDNKGNLLVISQFEANSLVPILRGQWAKPQVFLHIYSPRVTRDGYRFDRFAFHSVPTAPDPPPTYSALSQFNIFAGQLYPSTYQEYICLCNWLGISTSMGSRAQPDGFVLPKNRGDLLEILLYCVFQQSPVGLVRELLNVRRKRQDFSLTPLGKMLHAQAVRPVDVERAQ